MKPIKEIKRASSPSKHLKGSKISKNIKNAIDKLTVIEESLEDVTIHPSNIKNFMFLEDIDLLKILDATVYKTKITNESYDISKIITSINFGFSNLMCTKDK